MVLLRAMSARQKYGMCRAGGNAENVAEKDSTNARGTLAGYSVMAAVRDASGMGCAY